MRKAIVLLALFLLVACSQTPAESPPGPGEVTTSVSGSETASELPLVITSEPPTRGQPESEVLTPIYDELLKQAPSLLWQAKIGEGFSAPAQLAGGRVIVANDTDVIAFQPQSGAEIWRLRPDEAVWPRSLAADHDRIYIGIPGGLLAIRAIDGHILWQVETEGDVLWPPLASDNLYVGTAFVGPGVPPNPEGRAWIYALNPETGEKFWAYETIAYSLTTPTEGAGVVFIGGSFLGEDDVEEGGHLRVHAFDGRDGLLLWTKDSRAGFLKSLATDGSRLFYLAYSDFVQALDASNGQEVWRYQTENWSPGFTFAGDRLYFGSDNAFIHAVESSDGSVGWRVHLEGVFNSPRARPEIANDCLLFQANDNRLYCFHLEDGTLTWQSEPQSRSRVSLTAGDGRLFLTGQDGILYAYGAE